MKNPQFRNIIRPLFGGSILGVVATGILGCGGGLGSIPNNDPVPVNVDGGFTTTESTSPVAIVASDDPTPVLLTPPGGGDPIQAYVPEGISVAKGQSLAIIPSGTVLEGLTGGARSPGDITVNGKKTKVKFINGKLSPALALPKGRYTLSAEGPFTLREANTILTMQTVVFNFDCDGKQFSLPTSLHGKIPGNGSNNWRNSITAGFNSDYREGTATLTITHSNGTLDQTDPVTADGTATFKDFKDDVQSHIPRQGVKVVSFTHYGTTPP